MRLRTYAVVCINEECGVLEWVNHTDCLRSIIAQAHNYWPEVYPPLGYREIYHQFVEMQSKFEDDLPTLAKQYTALFQQYRPYLHRWYLETFRDATEWLEARTLYTRSVAVWSGVGHVIGLGDRHTENILIDVTNGECVHVDFDCLFDKGLILAKPEIIPFRLTQNMVDAMGVTGVEGCYRKTLEVTLKVLREHKDMLLSVLEPFLRDPTVAWGRSGRAQRSEQPSSSAASTTRNNTSTTTEHENKEAKEMLQKIEGRLNGVYNLMHPHREKFLRAVTMRGQGVPSRGIGPAKEELLPLSVQGQAQRLMDEATCVENLAQLYIGWQPWL